MLLFETIGALQLIENINFEKTKFQNEIKIIKISFISEFISRFFLPYRSIRASFRKKLSEEKYMRL